MIIKNVILDRLLRYTSPYRRRIAAALMAMIVVGMLTSLLAYLVKPAINRIFSSHDRRFLFFICAGIVVIAFVRGIFSYIQNYLMAWVGQRVVMDLRNQLYTHLHSLSLSYFFSHRTGHLISRLTNDIMYIQNAVTYAPCHLIRDGTSAVFLTGVIFYLNWQWALLALLVLPLLGYPLKKFSRKMRRSSHRVQEEMAHIYSFLEEKISGIKIVKSFTQEEEEIEKMKEANLNFFSQVMRLIRAAILQRPFMEFITFTGAAVVVMIGGLSVMNQKMDVGSLFSFLAALNLLYAPVKNFASVNQEIQQAMAAGDRVFRILDTVSFVKDSPDAKIFSDFRGGIVYENVSFRYHVPASTVQPSADEPEPAAAAVSGISL